MGTEGKKRNVTKINENGLIYNVITEQRKPKKIKCMHCSGKGFLLMNQDKRTIEILEYPLK